MKSLLAELNMRYFNSANRLKLIVEDTGTGMTEDEQQRVFGAFERLSNAAAKDGFGLGFLQPAVIQQPG